MALQDLINQDAYVLDDERSRQRLLRHVQKLTNATNISFPERALQQDQIGFLTRINNEAKVRRSTKSLVIGKAKVMSYQDLEEARVKRAAKEQAKAKGSGQCGRKPKSAMAEADEAAKEQAPTGDKKGTRKRKRQAPETGMPTKVARVGEASEQTKAPVARII